MKLLEYLALRYLEKGKHYNKLFYSLSPELAVATVRAFREVEPYLLHCGAYYEFGVFKGYNLWLAHKLQPLIPCYGFDSFDGMPRVKGAHPHHSRGMYKASYEEVDYHLKMNGADMRRIALYKGYFSDSYFTSLQLPFEAVAVAVIDSDLYESCVPVLRFLRPLLRVGSILLFDEWKMDAPSEREAWNELVRRDSKLKAEEIFDYGCYGRALRVEKVG